MTDFYSVAFNGSYFGQSIINVFWYRMVSLFPPPETLFNTRAALAAEIKERFWDSIGVVGNTDWRLKDLMPTDYTLENLTVTCVDDLGSLIASDPFVLPIAEAGNLAIDMIAPSACVIARANLSAVVGPGIGLPKRGYMAFGPIAEDYVGEDGRMDVDGLARWSSFAGILGQLVECELPAVTLAPVRVRQIRIPNVTPPPKTILTGVTYKDALTWEVDPVLAWRASRKPEA